MSELPQELRAELEDALRKNEGQLGKVFALLADGKTTNRELVEGGAAANQGAAANLRVTVRAVLEGVLPKGPSVAAQSRRSIGGILRDNSTLSAESVMHLEKLRKTLEAIETDIGAIAKEDKVLEQGSRELEKTLEKISGVYVFSLPSFVRTVQKTDPERFWFKIGKTDRLAGIRVGEIKRATGLPEDPILVRVYQHPEKSPRDIEQKFHLLLDAAGHSRAGGQNSGKDWFATNLEFLDSIARAIGCEIAESSVQSDDL